jgi:hypothetical protein
MSKWKGAAIIRLLTVIAMGAVVGCAALPPLPHVVTDATICQQAEPALGRLDADVRAVRQTSDGTASQAFVSGQACFVSNDRITQTPSSVQPSYTAGMFTHDGEMFYRGGQVGALTAGPGDPLWVTPFTSHDAIDAKDLNKLGPRTVVQVSTPCASDKPCTPSGMITRSWVRRNGIVNGDAPHSTEPHCLGHSPRKSGFEVRDLHLLINMANRNYSVSACMVFRDERVFNTVALNVTALYKNGQRFPVIGGNTIFGVTPLRDRGRNDPATIVQLGTAVAVPLFDTQWDKKADVRVTWQECGKQDVTNCTSGPELSMTKALTIDFGNLPPAR